MYILYNLDFIPAQRNDAELTWTCRSAGFAYFDYNKPYGWAVFGWIVFGFVRFDLKAFNSGTIYESNAKKIERQFEIFFSNVR